MQTSTLYPKLGSHLVWHHPVINLLSKLNTFLLAEDPFARLSCLLLQFVVTQRLLTHTLRAGDDGADFVTLHINPAFNFAPA